MSASTQATELNRPPTVTNNGQKGPRKARGPNKAKAKARAPTTALPQNATGAAALPPSNVAARRIGSIPTAIASIASTTSPATGGPLAWLYARQMEIEIEARMIRSMIASFRPGTAAAGAVRTAKRKKAKRKTAAPARAA